MINLAHWIAFRLYWRGLLPYKVWRSIHLRYIMRILEDRGVFK